MHEIDTKSAKIPDVTHEIIHKCRAPFVGQIHKVNEEIREIEKLKDGIIESFITLEDKQRTCIISSAKKNNK